MERLVSAKPAPNSLGVMKINYTKSVQYLMAVALIVSSIAMAFYQILDIDDIANGTLMYIAQAFLLAGSIFGLDYYVKKLNYVFKKEQDSKGNKEQQPAEHTSGE